MVGIGAGSEDGTTGELVWAVMAEAIGRWVVPMSSLTDNGLCYITRHRPSTRPAAFDANLAALGCQSVGSRSGRTHQTGGVERR